MKKQIKQRKCNKKKYCLDCNELVEMKVEGRVGYCPLCSNKLYLFS